MTKMARAVAVALALLTTLVFAPPVHAQNVERILSDLESQGWYIEAGAEGSASGFDSLVRRSASSSNTWYFVSMAGPVGPDFADVLRDDVRPTGNVIVYYVDNEDFLNVQLASGAGESVEDQALAPFDEDWATPDEFMGDVVTTFDRLTSGATATTGSSGSTSGEDSGGGLGWLWIAIPIVAIIGLVVFSGRSRRKKQEADALEAAQKLRAQIQTELDELANDVLVLSGPVDLSDEPQAVQHYRDAAATYTAISDEIPDLDQLQNADLGELADLGARVAHARWQMDAAEALIDGEPIPEKPKVEPPPPPPRPSTPAPAPAPRIPQRQPRPRVPYSPSRRRGGGGGLLDIIIGGAGMLGAGSRRGGGGGMFGGPSRSGRSGGGMFGGPSRSGRSPNRPRPGGGVFGSGSSRSGGSRRRSTSRSRSRSSSRSRSRSRSSSSRRSSSRRRRR